MQNKAVIASIVVGTVLVIVGAVLGWAVFPNMVTTQIGENVALIKGTDQYKRFEKLPLAFDFKVYFFNVTNRDKANEGEQPEVQQLGPYIYRQTREKQNISHVNESYITYYEYMNFEYNEDKSKDLKDTDVVTILNPAANGVMQLLELQHLDPILEMLNDDEVRSLVFNQSDIYMDITVNDFLFGGYKLCNFDELKNGVNYASVSARATIVCFLLMVMPAKNIKVDEAGITFSFLNHKNITHDGHYTINDGVDDKKKLAEIYQWEDKPYLEFWGNESTTCNKVKGRDAVIFPPFIEETETLTVFNTDICRTVDLKYSGKETVRDVETMKFTLPEDTLSAPNKEFGNECYCLNSLRNINDTEQISESGCVKKGLMELFTCYNAPIILSFPHFYGADEVYQKSVKGLNANKKEHETFVHLEPNTGTPLAGSKRVQFNMFIKNVNNLNFLENYTKPVLMPIIWLDEHVDITNDLYDELRHSYFDKLVLVDGVRWGLIGVGIFVVVVTVIIHCIKSKKSKQTV